MALPILTNDSATGDTTLPLEGGEYIWATDGTFGGATVKLQFVGPDGSSLIDVAGASMTAEGSLSLKVGRGTQLKAVVAGGSPSALYSSLSKVG